MRGHNGVCRVKVHAAPDGAWVGLWGLSTIVAALLTELSGGPIPLERAKNPNFKAQDILPPCDRFDPPARLSAISIGWSWRIG